MESQQDRLARKIEAAKVRAAAEKLAQRPAHEFRQAPEVFDRGNFAGPSGVVVENKPTKPQTLVPPLPSRAEILRRIHVALFGPREDDPGIVRWRDVIKFRPPQGS